MDKWIIKGKWDCEVDVIAVNNYGLLSYFEEQEPYDTEDPDTIMGAIYMELKEHIADRLSPEGLQLANDLLNEYLNKYKGSRDRPTSYKHSIEDNVLKWTRL